MIKKVQKVQLIQSVQKVQKVKGSQGNSQESDDPRKVPWANFSDNSQGLSTALFFRLSDKNSQDYQAPTYPRVNTEHIAVLLQ